MFLGEPTPDPLPPPSTEGNRLMTAVTAGVLVTTVSISIFAGPISRATTIAATALLVPTGDPFPIDQLVEEGP